MHFGPEDDAGVTHLLKPCRCGAGTVADCVANTCAKVQRRVAWPPGLLDRIKAAEQRIQDNHAPRRIPADPNGDVDLVLAEVRYLIEGNWPPFWIKDASGVREDGNG